jgi:hypothetical protein
VLLWLLFAIQDSLFFHFKDTDTAYKQQLLTIKRGLSCDAKDPDARDWVESVLCSGGVAFDDSTCATLTPEAMMNRCGLAAAQKRNPVWIHAVCLQGKSQQAWQRQRKRAVWRELRGGAGEHRHVSLPALWQEGLQVRMASAALAMNASFASSVLKDGNRNANAKCVDLSKVKALLQILSKAD